MATGSVCVGSTAGVGLSVHTPDIAITITFGSSVAGAWGYG